jgi:hypothetical protein
LYFSACDVAIGPYRLVEAILQSYTAGLLGLGEIAALLRNCR